jgi:hypothetical protein
VLLLVVLTGCTRTKIVYVDRATTTSESTTTTSLLIPVTFGTLPTPTVTEPPTTRPTAPPAPAPPQTAPPATITRQWVVVSSISGAGDKDGPTFQLAGNEQRARWQSTGYSYFHIARPGGTKDSVGGCPDGGCSDTGYPHEPAGDYYLSVIAVPTAQWSFTVEELR